MRKYVNQKKWRVLATGVLLAVSASTVATVPAWAAEYTKGLTGVVKTDMKIIGNDGNTIEQDGNMITYDFKGQDHTFRVLNKDGIGTNTDNDENNYVFNNISADGSKGTLHIYQTNDRDNEFSGVTGFSASNGNITINSNLDITAYSAYASVGVSAGKNANLIINGNVKMRKDDASNPWGIITKNVHGNYGPGGAASEAAPAYTGARWQPSAFSVGSSLGNITVNGDVDVAVRGTAVKTDAYEGKHDVNPYDLASISLIGDSIKIITPDNERNEAGNFKEAYYSLASYGGTVNVNVKDGNATGGKTELVGNVIALKRSERTDKADVYQNGRINIGLTTQDSSWRGVIDNAGTDHAGEVNVWLKNGAQWIHEATSRTNGLDYINMPEYSKPSYDNYDNVSYVNQLYGGKGEANSGFITQNSAAKLNIANYSGYNTIIYKHDNNGTEKAHYLGGDTVIGHAASASGITLATANNGINLDSSSEVAKVLNALASKLTYTGYTTGESNLSGTVTIASGLTASSITAAASGMISFDANTGVGGYIKPAEGEQTTNLITSSITGVAASDVAYSNANILKDDGVYKFTITPTTINVADGSAIKAADVVEIEANDITLNLLAQTGVETQGKNVDITARKLYIEADKGIVAANGAQVTALGTTDIKASTAITAGNGAAVTLGNGMIEGKVISDNAYVVINKGGLNKAASLIGDIAVANNGSVDVTVSGVNESFTGNIVKNNASGIATFSTGGDGTVNLTVANGAVWTGAKQNADAELKLTLSAGIWENTNTADSTVESLLGGNGTLKTISYLTDASGNKTNIPVNGFIKMNDGAGAVTVNNYSGTHIVSYAHDNSGADVADYKGGNFTINNAEVGSMVIAATDSKNVKTSNQDAVEATLGALAKKFIYAKAGIDTNLSGKAMIASGLTASSYTRWIGDMTFNSADGGKGQFINGSAVNVVGDYETAIMKGARAAMTSSLLSWRDNAANTIYRGDLLRAHMENDGIWARTYGGKDKYSSDGIGLQNDYWGAEVGYDRMYDNGWIAGLAVDYQKGNSSYNYTDEDFGNVGNNKGDNKLYSIGVYGSKDLGNGAHLDVAAKAGSVKNEFTVYNGIGNELDGTYRNRGYSASVNYGKRFGSEKSYWEPQVKLTWAHLDAKDYDAHSDMDTLNITQGSYDSFVGRIGVEAGKIGRLGSVYARAGLAHEFGGDINSTYNAADVGTKSTSYSTKDTWAELAVGTTLNVTDNSSAYFDVSKSFGGDYRHDWKISGGLRFALDKIVKPVAVEGDIAEAKALLHDNQAQAAAGEQQQTAAITDSNVAANIKTDAEKALPVAQAESAAAPQAHQATTFDGEYYTTVEGGGTVYASDVENEFELAPMVITASRVAEPILQAKADISVVSRDEIETMHVENVEEALRTVPGVQFMNYGANGANANLGGVRLNGSNDVVILVDGVRMNDFKGTSQSGYMFAALMNNMDNIEKIEVLRGSASAMYGSAAKGGVINIITRKPTKNKTVIDISQGNFGKEAYNFNNQGVKGKLAYNIYHDRSISGSTKDGSGKVWEGHSNTKSSGLKTEYAFDENHKLTFNYDTVGSHYNGTDYIYKGKYVGTYDSDSFTLKHDWKLSDQWENTLVYRHNKEKYSYAKPGGEDPSMLIPITGDTEYQLFGEQFKYQLDRNTLIGGIDYTKGKDNITNKEITNTSLYLQDDWEILPDVTLSGGVRHDRPENYSSRNTYSYKLGWDVTEKDTIYAGRSEYFILPSLTQMYDRRFGNSNLKPAEGRTTSIGYNHEFTTDNYMMLNWFETKAGTGLTYSDDGQYQNSKGGVIRGWNAQYNARLHENWMLKLGWAHLFYDEQGSFSMGYAPKDKATFGVYFDKDKVSAAFDGFYFMRDTRNVKSGVKGWPADKYGIYNLSLNYAADKQTKLYFKVDNIFNKLWAEHTDVIWNGGADSWYAMPGRSFVVGMQYSF